jgi:spore maturation protein SpmB
MYGFSRRVKVYESLVQGAKEGFQIAVMIIPFLVAILVAVGMFRASGALGFLIEQIQPLTSALGIPAESLPMALVRPLSGQGAFAVMSETLTQYGPDSFIGWVVSVINGSTETTFYVLAIYFGSIQVRVTRHTVIACLAADLTGFVTAVAWCRVFFTPV